MQSAQRSRSGALRDHFFAQRPLHRRAERLGDTGHLASGTVQ